ncbi:MAG: glycosyltransferase family 39 protein [Pseudomonadota bacterium]
MSKARKKLGVRLSRWALRHPIWVFALGVAALTTASLGAKDLWVPDETRHGAVLLQMLENGHWLALHLGEEFYADKPPLYFWLLAALALATGSTGPPVFMAAAALSGWAFLAALAVLGRRAGLSRQAVLTAGLILLSTWFFVERLHHPRMDLLFGAFIMLAQAGMLSAVQTGRGAPLAFAAAGLAVLTKGPLGIALPLVSLLAGLMIYRPHPPGLGRDLSAGITVFVAMMALYLGGVAWVAGWGAVAALLFDQSLGRAVAAPSLSQPVWWYIGPLAAALLPWTLAVAAVRPRHLQRGGTGWLWASLAGSFVLLSLLDYKTTHFLVLLIGPLALGLAQALCHVSAGPRRVMFLGMAALIALAAALLPFAPGWTLWPEQVQGALLVAAATALAAALALLAHRRATATFAATLWIGITVTALPYYLITIHGLDAVMSPRAAGEALAREAALGRPVVEYHPSYRGIFDYHAGLSLTQVESFPALDAVVAQHPCGTVAMRARDASKWETAPKALAEISQHRLDATRYVLLRWGGLAC